MISLHVAYLSLVFVFGMIVLNLQKNKERYICVYHYLTFMFHERARQICFQISTNKVHTVLLIHNLPNVCIAFA